MNKNKLKPVKNILQKIEEEQRIKEFAEECLNSMGNTSITYEQIKAIIEEQEHRKRLITFHSVNLGVAVASMGLSTFVSPTFAFFGVSWLLAWVGINLSLYGKKLWQSPRAGNGSNGKVVSPAMQKSTQTTKTGLQPPWGDELYEPVSPKLIEDFTYYDIEKIVFQYDFLPWQKQRLITLLDLPFEYRMADKNRVLEEIDFCNTSYKKLCELRDSGNLKIQNLHAVVACIKDIEGEGDPAKWQLKRYIVDRNFNNWQKEELISLIEGIR